MPNVFIDCQWCAHRARGRGHSWRGLKTGRPFHGPVCDHCWTQYQIYVAIASDKLGQDAGLATIKDRSDHCPTCLQLIANLMEQSPDSPTEQPPSESLMGESRSPSELADHDAPKGPATHAKHQKPPPAAATVADSTTGGGYSSRSTLGPDEVAF